MALKDDPKSEPVNKKLSGFANKRTVTFKEPAGRPPSSVNRYLSTSWKEETDKVRRPASVLILDKSRAHEDEELSNEMRHLSLRPKSVSPSFLGRCVSPSHSRVTEIPTVHIPPTGQYGLGKIFLRMPDITKPGLTKTLSLSYSTSGLNHNSRLLTEDIDMTSKRRDKAQSTLVRRIEQRLQTLRKNKEAFMKAMEEEERKRKEEEEDKIDFVKRTKNLLIRGKSEAFMTVAERKQKRKERIRTRTSLLHYRTANHLKRFDDKHIKKLKSQVTYSRNVELGGTE